MKTRLIGGALFASLCLTVLCSCGAPAPPLPPSLELAKPVTDLQASRKGNTVFLTWTVPSETTDSQLIRHLGPTRICRVAQANSDQCGTAVGEVQTQQPISRSIRGKKKPEITPVRAGATDTLPEDLQQRNPTGVVNYAVEMLNTHGRSAGLSNLAPIPLAPTLAPPSDLAAKGSDQGVTLTWTVNPPASQIPRITYLYRVYRGPVGAGNRIVAGEVPLADSPQLSFIDHGAGWQARYQYQVTPVTVIAGQGSRVQVEGADSSPLTVFVNDIYPPENPSGLEAVYSGVGQTPFVELTWAPVTAADLAGYNIYRREEGSEPMKINTGLAKTPAFRDNNVESGKRYFYSVTAVDLRNNESARSDEASEKVPALR